MGLPRKRIPKGKRRAIWVKHIGQYIFRTKCPCCNSTEIDPFTFEAGHIHPHSKGGSDDISNLVPICSICNKDMGSENMKIYMKKIFNRILWKAIKNLKYINKRAKKIFEQ